MRTATSSTWSVLHRFVTASALILSTTGQAENSAPTLSTTDAWLQANLPTWNYAVSWRSGDTSDNYADNSLDGCIWTVRKGHWYERGVASDREENKQVTVITFQPRSGMAFAHRKMTAAEAEAFSAKHKNTGAGGHMTDHGELTGYVDTIDLSAIRPASFKIFTRPESFADNMVGANGSDYGGLTTDDVDLAPRLLSALRHAAALCGAKDDPF